MLSIFGFTLQNAQIDAIYIFFYKQRDLLLFIKTRFSKSLIFQLLPFLFNSTSVIIIFMSFKLL